MVFIIGILIISSIVILILSLKDQIINIKWIILPSILLLISSLFFKEIENKLIQRLHFRVFAQKVFAMLYDGRKYSFDENVFDEIKSISLEDFARLENFRIISKGLVFRDKIRTVRFSEDLLFIDSLEYNISSICDWKKVLNKENKKLPLTRLYFLPDKSYSDFMLADLGDYEFFALLLFCKMKSDKHHSLT